LSTGILVVDDNADAADTLAALLSFEGYETHVAHDGPTALARFDEHSPQIVLLDIGMPGMDGYAVVRELRSRPEGRRARIMALTGWGSERDRQRTLEAGFDDHLVKPIEFDQLVHLLHESPTVVRPPNA
jgi:CheY-like chemotaxis protein